MSQHISILSHYQSKTVVITGGVGYIGSSIIRALKGIACRIIVVDREAKEIPSDATAEISVQEADIRKKSVWNELLSDADILFHLAAQTSSKVANEKPGFDAELNLFPVIHLIETCRKKGCFPHIVFSGTVTQVGFTETYPVDESFRDDPITVYDINKLAAEKYLQFYTHHLGGSAVTLRLANVYGPGPRSGSADRGILNIMIKKALRGEPLTVYGDGNFVRDYVYVDDVTRAFLTAGAKKEILGGNYYVIGSGKGTTINEAARLIKSRVEKKTKKEAEIIYVAPPEDLSQIEYRHFVADTKSFGSATGWKAEISLLEGIDRTINYFLKES